MINIKRIAASLMVAATMVTGAVGTISASANNSADTSFSNFSVSSTVHYTSSRSKTDATSATVKINSVSYSGATATVRVYTGNYVDKTYGTAPVVGVSSYYTYLPNTVYEDGYRTARLGFTRASGPSTFTISGVWSPDSV